MKKLIFSAIFVGLLLPLTLHAQSMGTYCWRLNPFKDILCFDIENKGFVFDLTGTQETSAYVVPSHGAATSGHSVNRFHLGFTSHFIGGLLGQFSVSISKETLDGAWTDNLGLSGKFTFLGTGPLDRPITGISGDDYLSHITLR